MTSSRTGRAGDPFADRPDALPKPVVPRTPGEAGAHVRTCRSAGA
ncbi:hypothetical protein [Streptomyces nitrosporeus]